MSQTNNSGTSIPQSEVTRVKGLGFLWDKRTPDKFNGRVITRNGKITAKECAAIAQAAERFGSGEVTLTTRMTMEIQGVPFENIEPMREFLRQEAGLETGGTGAKVALWSPVRAPPVSTALSTPMPCPRKSTSASMWAIGT